MIELIVMLFFFGVLGFFALVAFGVIGGTAIVVGKAITAPTVNNATQVRSDLERYYSRGNFDRADELYRKLPNWPVTKHLRYAATLHGDYHRKLTQAVAFFRPNDHGLSQRLEESSSLFSNYADLAGRIAFLNDFVNGHVDRLDAETSQELEARSKEMQKISTYLLAMGLELQKAGSRRDTNAARMISDSLAEQYDQMRAMNESYQAYKRISNHG